MDAHFSYLKTHITNEVKRGQGMSDIKYSVDAVSVLNSGGGMASSSSFQMVIDRNTKLKTIKSVQNVRFYHQRQFTYSTSSVTIQFLRNSFRNFNKVSTTIKLAVLAGTNVQLFHHAPRIEETRKNPVLFKLL